MLDVVHSPLQSLSDALEFDDLDHSIAATQLDLASLHGNCGPRFELGVGGVMCRGTQCTMDLTCAREHHEEWFWPTVSVQDVVQSNPSTSQMTGDAEQPIHDPDSDSEGPFSCWRCGG